jgi:isoleucyl-tRNA synthetase
LEGIKEVQRKFLGTLYNTYAFFALYANVDGFTGEEDSIPLGNRPEMDRWILSRLNTLIDQVGLSYDAYECTRAGRLIQEFVCDQLSNWYVRLCRRRFWKSEDSIDKLSAYQTLFTALETISILAAPIAPFFMERLYLDLTKKKGLESVHLCMFPIADANQMDLALEEQMDLAQRITSMVLSLRKKEKIRVRQPLHRIIIPALNPSFVEMVHKMASLIQSEVNVKHIEMIEDDGQILTKQIKPNFKTIGPKYGKQMKSIAGIVANFTQEDIASVEQNLGWTGEIDGTTIELDMADFEINAQDIPGWLVASEGGITVALDITLSPELKAEGIAREVVNRIQNMRKDAGFEVTDRIAVQIQTTDVITDAIKQFEQYICTEVLANNIAFTMLENGQQEAIEAEGDTVFNITKSN